jgi:hypothetical protein
MPLIFISMLVICTVGIMIGLDLKKPVSWLFVLCGFIMGFTFGISKDNWRLGIGAGIVSAILVIYAGNMIFIQKRFLKDRFYKNKKKKQ